jgi:uncharacterized membrane protein YsdA (DUF1294 family)
MLMQFEYMFPIYFAAINAVTFFMFWLDKRRSKAGVWRVSENKLLGPAMLGGSLGALLAQQVYRHKTTKQPFRGWLIAIALYHIVLAIFLFVAPLRHLTFSTVDHAINYCLSALRQWQNSR